MTKWIQAKIPCKITQYPYFNKIINMEVIKTRILLFNNNTRILLDSKINLLSKILWVSKILLDSKIKCSIRMVINRTLIANISYQQTRRALDNLNNSIMQTTINITTMMSKLWKYSNKLWISLVRQILNTRVV